MNVPVECEEAVIEKIRLRRNAGLIKYGVTVDRTDLTKLQWLTHAQEEAMDLAKAITEQANGKLSVVVYPVDKWVLMMLKATGATNVRNLGDVRWCAIEDGSQGKGTGRHIAAFILEPKI